MSRSGEATGRWSAITTVGITTQGAMKAVEVLEAGRLRDDRLPRGRHRRPGDGEMMREGVIGAVLDYSTIEVSNEMHTPCSPAGRSG